jgi:hypothetical protein
MLATLAWGAERKRVAEVSMSKPWAMRAALQAVL